MVRAVARGALRFLGVASSRNKKIYGDLAKIYGAPPQFFATVSGLSFAHKAQRDKCTNQCFRNRVAQSASQESHGAGGREDSSVPPSDPVETLVDRLRRQ